MFKEAPGADRYETWSELLEDLFEADLPEQEEWTSTEAIVKVLRKLTEVADGSQIIFPDQGSLKFEEISLKHLSGKWLEFNSHPASNLSGEIAPSRLIFLNVCETADQSAFWLEGRDRQSPKEGSSQTDSSVSQVDNADPRILLIVPRAGNYLQTNSEHSGGYHTEFEPQEFQDYLESELS
jgi:hypothetical protein